MSLKNKEQTLAYLHDQNLLSIVFSPYDTYIKSFGLLHNEVSNNKDILWAKDHQAVYIPCIVIITEQFIERDSIDEKIEFAQSHNMAVKRIIGHYLVSDKNKDYYQCWLEAVEKNEF